LSIIKHVTLQKIVAHDFRYDLRRSVGCWIGQRWQNKNYVRQYRGVYVFGKLRDMSNFERNGPIKSESIIL
jgi:hypothetical protein